MTGRPDLDAIQARVDAASDGPWECHAYHVFMDGRAQVRVARPGHPGVFMATMLGSDAEFVAHAREDVPQLVMWLRTLRQLADGGGDAELAACKTNADDVLKLLAGSRQPTHEQILALAADVRRLVGAVAHLRAGAADLSLSSDSGPTESESA